MSTIEDLKNNCKPFGLMTAEMQAKAREIGELEFEHFDNEWKPVANGSHSFNVERTYRLRPDYCEKPEIVEMPVYEDGDCLVFDKWKPAINLIYATSCPDFIGFKYEDDTIENKIWSVPRVYLVGEGEYSVCGNSGDKVLTPTHVRFRDKQ